MDIDRIVEQMPRVKLRNPDYYLDAFVRGYNDAAFAQCRLDAQWILDQELRKVPSEHEWYLWFLSVPPGTPPHELAARTRKWLMGESCE